MGSTAALSEIWFLAAVSYDRFSGIHHPLDTQKRTSNKQVCCKRSTPNTNKILSTKNSKNSWQCYFVFFLTSCGNETGSHHNCCILGMLYRIVDSSYGWMEQLRIRGKIRKFLTTTIWLFHSAMSFITSFMFFSVVSHGMRIQYVLTSLVRPFLWSDSISILFCLTTTRDIIILFGAHLPCTLKWKDISRKK